MDGRRPSWSWYLRVGLCLVIGGINAYALAVTASVNPWWMNAARVAILGAMFVLIFRQEWRRS